MNDKTPDIKYLFEPRGVAIIGASSDKTKIGYKLLENVITSEYRGNIYPINPKGGEISGLKVYKSVAEAPGEIDLVTIVVPAKFVFDAVKSCAEKKVKFISIITSGFSEIGNLEEEKKIATFATEHGMRILGPNIFGIFSAMAPINATFGPKDIMRGNVAIITQSGALGIAMIGKTKTENIGLSAIVSVGNKSDIDEADLLEYLIGNADTKVILMYIEGVKQGARLVSALKKATMKKPVIVIKSGRSKRGALAAASHTGSLAGADEVFSAIMNQCGVHRADTIQDALDWCKFLSSTPMPAGENTVIITNGGGIGVLAADACEKYNVALYDDIQTMKTAFSDIVPEFGSLKNPVDITGQATMEDYEKAISAALKAKDIDSIVCLGCETATWSAETLSTTIEKKFNESKTLKPIVFSFFGGSKTEQSITYLKSAGVPVFAELYESVSCLGALYKSYRIMQSNAHETQDNIIAKKYAIDANPINHIISRVQYDKRNFLLSNEAQGVMRSAKVPVPESYVAKNITEAVSSAEKIGYPVVMKIVSKDILHKSDAGGVALDLDNKNEVIDAYQAILHSCRKYNPNAAIDGVEVSEMVKKGTETIIGARRDPSFGPVIMFGLGGIYVEVMKDVSFRALPLTKKEAIEMIKEIKSYPLLLGVRGEEKKDIDAIVDAILKVGTILEKCPSISDIEINPLVVYEQGEGAKAVDARILIYKSNPNGGDING